MIGCQIGFPRGATALFRMKGVNSLVNSIHLHGALRSIHDTLKQTHILTKNLKAQTAPAVAKVLDEARKTLASAHDLLRQGST